MPDSRDSPSTKDPEALRSEILPLFPLASVVLFPELQVPLFIFEPRYRQMVEAALAGDRLIGMVTAVPQQLDQMPGDPEVFPIGCAGRIESCNQRDDGTYNIVLAGIARFRLERELDRPEGQLFRRAQTTFLIDDTTESDAGVARQLRARVHERYGELLARTAPQYLQQLQSPTLAEISDEIYANTISLSLDIDSIEKQSLLEAPSTTIRLERLLAVLDFKLANPLPSGPANPTSIQ
jgi:Lon protease-like protein